MITDQIIKNQKINIINIQDYGKLNFMRDFKKLGTNNYAKNPLWLTSLERIFYIEKYVNDININQFVHFDNDVVLFGSFDFVINKADLNKQAFHLTL